MLNVTIYPDLTAVRESDPDNLDISTIVGGVTFVDVKYVSLVTDETYGPPALIAPARGSDSARAAIGETVLYINTNLVPIWEIERVSD